VALFDGVLAMVAERAVGWQDAGALRELPAEPWPAGRTLLLRHDTGLELGPPGEPSNLILAWTAQGAMAGGTSARLVGPDLEEAAARGAGRLPLGLVVVVAGDLPDRYASHTALRDALLSTELSGVMLRHLPAGQGVWLRVGRQALEQGIDAAALCGGLARNLAEVPGVRGVEVTLVTGPPERVAALTPAARAAAQLVEALFRMEHEDLEMACEACDLSELCDNVEELRRAHQRITTTPPSR